MDFLELAKKRTSCRSYEDTPVEREKTLACIEAARMGPSACNSQPWSFIIVDDEQVATKVSYSLQDKITPLNKFTKNCSNYIVLVEEPANISAKLGARFKDQEFAQIDIGIAAMSISLAALDQGLGTCMIGWFNEKELKTILNIPKGKRIRLVISVGYPKSADQKSKSRKQIDEIVHMNKW